MAFCRPDEVEGVGMSVSYAGRLGRPRRWLSRLGVVAVVVLVAACGSSNATGTPVASSGASSGASTAASAPAASGKAWMDATKSVDDRVAALLSQMTLAEKIGQMTQIENKAPSLTDVTVTQYGLGSILSGGGGSPAAGNTPQAWYDMVNGYQQAALATRLGIPMLYGLDALA